MSKSLYICYFGVREPLVQTQVIPYLRELVKGGHEIILLTFEPSSRTGTHGAQDETKANLSEQGIQWYSLKYHKRFSVVATAYDIFRGAAFIRSMIGDKDLNILHGRSHVSTLMGALARSFSRRKPKLLFDIRGFFPEEYTDAGIWPENGWLYRATKRVEEWLLKTADGFVVLTERAREILFTESKETGYDRLGRPIEVIPCCVDLSRFSSVNTETRATVRELLGINDRYTVAYVGAFGGWYLTEETADFFGTVKKTIPNAFAMVLTQSKPEMIEPLLRARGYENEDFLITRVPPAEIPAYLGGADAAVSFIKNCYSKQASSPTKNAEYLACGLPIVANSGIGDVNSLIDENKVGALIESFTPEAYRNSILAVRELNGIGSHCREVSRREFDLASVGGDRYRRIYHRLSAK